MGRGSIAFSAGQVMKLSRLRGPAGQLTRQLIDTGKNQRNCTEIIPGGRLVSVTSRQQRGRTRIFFVLHFFFCNFFGQSSTHIPFCCSFTGLIYSPQLSLLPPHSLLSLPPSFPSSYPLFLYLACVSGGMSGVLQYTISCSHNCRLSGEARARGERLTPAAPRFLPPL